MRTCMQTHLHSMGIPKCSNLASSGLVCRAGGQEDTTHRLGLLLIDFDKHPVPYRLNASELHPPASDQHTGTHEETR